MKQKERARKHVTEEKVGQNMPPVSLEKYVNGGEYAKKARI